VNRTLLAVLLVCALSVSAGTVAGVSTEPAFPQQDIDPDDVLMSITVEDDGDAVWSIEYRTRLETDDDETAFEDLRDDIEADPDPYTERFRDRMNGTAASASNATGREMSITEMSVSAEKQELPQQYGVLTYTFRWSNFAAVDGDRLLVGDAIGGLFLDEETALLISWSQDYELLDISPNPTETRSDAVVYEGPTDFASDEPRVELGPPETAPSEPDSSSDPGGSAVSPLTGVALFILFFGGAAAAFVAYRRRGGSAGAESVASESSGTGEGTSGPPDEELLSNEEQVLQLIESEGGRMKQKAVAEQLGWTDAKTSQVTKKLRENGDLEGFRLGRENVLSLPEDDSESE
jgi:uncharacterized membrane protein